MHGACSKSFWTGFRHRLASSALRRWVVCLLLLLVPGSLVVLPALWVVKKITVVSVDEH
jgi:hypothetical protein